MSSIGMRRLCLFALLLACGAMLAMAQTGTGTVRGTVYDPGRSAIPGVKVVITHTATNVSREASSSEIGFFLFAGLQPGPYRLVVEKGGFKKWVGTLVLQAGQIAVVEPSLEVGSLETVVEVSGAAPVITTESSELGDVKDSLRIQQLPLNGRSVVNLFDLTPGVEGGGNPRVNGLKVGSAEMTLDGVSLVDRFGGGIARVQPGLDTVQEFRVETVGSNAQYSRPATITMVTKSGTNSFHGSVFETFRNNGGGLRARQRQDGNTAAFYARNEFGLSAGGPAYLGKLYDGRNKTFWFVAYEGLRERQKAFYQDHVPTASLWDGDFSSVIDAAGKKTTIYDPLTTNASGTRTPFTGNVIPKARLNGVYATMKSVTHDPTNSTNPYLDYNMSEWYPVKTNAENLTLKADHKFTDSDNLSVRYTRSHRFYTKLGGVFGAPRTDIDNGFGSGRNDAFVHNGSIRYTKTVTPTFLNELMLAVHRAPKSSGTMADLTDWPAKLGFPNPFGAQGWPTVYTDLFGWDADNRKDEMLTGYIVENNVTWVKGAHTIRFGGKFRPEQNNVRELQQAQGEHYFGAEWTAQYDPAGDNGVSYTGDSLASMALGLPYYLSAQYNRGYFYFRQKEIGLYVQDTWKVTPRLTLDLGVRWDKWTAYQEKYNRLVNLDARSLASKFEVVTPKNVTMEQIPGIPASVLASWKARGLTWTTAQAAGLPDSLVAGDNNNFGPRIGMAYKLSDKMVLRASYGEYFWTMPLSQILQSSRTNPPLNLRFETDYATMDGTGSYGIRTTPQSDYFIGKAAINTTGIVSLPSSARGFVPMSPFDWKDGRAQSWHFTLEREMMRNTAVRLSYIGDHARDMEQKYSLNSREAEFNYVARTGQNPPSNRDELRVNKNWSIANATNHTGFSNTHSLQAEFERRSTNGLAMQWFYVFSRAMTTSDAGGFQSGGGAINSTNGVFQVPENIQLLGSGNLTYDQRLRLGYQNSTNIPPHHIRWNGMYDLPFGRGKKFASSVPRVLDQVIGGWQVATLGEWRSGLWAGVNSARYLFGDPTLSADQRLLLTFAGKQRRLWFKGDFDPTAASNVNQQLLQQLVPVDRSQRVLRPLGSTFGNQLPQTLSNGTVRNTSITETVNWNARAFYLGPGAWNTDISVVKDFPLTERVKLRFSADFFNAFNHPNDAVPDTTTGLQDLSTQTNDPRIIQFSLRLSW